MEILCEQLHELDVVAPEAIWTLIDRIGRQMKLSPSYWMDLLRQGHVETFVEV